MRRVTTLGRRTLYVLSLSYSDLNPHTVVPPRVRQLTLNVIDRPDADGSFVLTQAKVGRDLWLLVTLDPGTPWNRKFTISHYLVIHNRQRNHKLQNYFNIFHVSSPLVLRIQQAVEPLNHTIISIEFLINYCTTLRKVNWKLTFLVWPIIKHLILSPDSLWRFWRRPVFEKCRKMSVTLKPFGRFWQNFAYALILTWCSPRDCQMLFGIGRGSAEVQILKNWKWRLPVREKCRKMSITLKPFGIFW